MEAFDRGDRNLTSATRSRELERGRAAFDIGSKLHNLALEYWAADRPQDALRVGLQAVKLLSQDCPRSALIAEVLATLGEIGQELRVHVAAVPAPDHAEGDADRSPGPQVPAPVGVS